MPGSKVVARNLQEKRRDPRFEWIFMYKKSDSRIKNFLEKPRLEGFEENYEILGEVLNYNPSKAEIICDNGRIYQVFPDWSLKDKGKATGWD